MVAGGVVAEGVDAEGVDAGGGNVSVSTATKQAPTTPMVRRTDVGTRRPPRRSSGSCGGEGRTLNALLYPWQP